MIERAKVLSQQDGCWALPISGFEVFQCKVDYAFTLAFSVGASGGSRPPWYELRLEGPFSCDIAGVAHSLDPEHAPAPVSLAPALALFKQQVTTAKALRNGVVRIEFDGGDVLEAGPDPSRQFEAWTFSGEGVVMVCLPTGEIWVSQKAAPI